MKQTMGKIIFVLGLIFLVFSFIGFGMRFHFLDFLNFFDYRHLGFAISNFLWEGASFLLFFGLASLIIGNIIKRSPDAPPIRNTTNKIGKILYIIGYFLTVFGTIGLIFTWVSFPEILGYKIKFFFSNGAGGYFLLGLVLLIAGKLMKKKLSGETSTPVFTSSSVTPTVRPEKRSKFNPLTILLTIIIIIGIACLIPLILVLSLMDTSSFLYGFNKAQKQLPDEIEVKLLSKENPIMFNNYYIFSTSTKRRSGVRPGEENNATKEIRVIDNVYKVQINEVIRGNYQLNQELLVLVQPYPNNFLDIFDKALSSGKTLTLTGKQNEEKYFYRAESETPTLLLYTEEDYQRLINAFYIYTVNNKNLIEK